MSHKKSLPIPDDQEMATVEMNEENMHLFPVEFQKAHEYIKAHRPVFPEKYYKSQRDKIKRDISALWKKQPDMPPKEVVLTIMKPLPSWLPASNIIEVTKQIIEEWEQLHKEEIFA